MGTVRIQIREKKAIAPKSISECSDRSGNVIDRKDMNFYTKAMSQIFIQLHLSAEIGGCEVWNKILFGFWRIFNEFQCKSAQIYIEIQWKSSKIHENIFCFIFSIKFCDLEKIFFFWKKSISTQNVPRNPKIILRTPCDEFKVVKKQESVFCSLFSGFWMIIVPFYVAVHVPLKDCCLYILDFGKKNPKTTGFFLRRVLTSILF